MIYIKDKKRKKHEFQFFMHQFIEAGIQQGFHAKKEFRNTRLTKTIVQSLDKSKLLSFLQKTKKNKQIIIASQGENLLEAVFPYFKYEIIPMLWDVWPYTWKKLLITLQKLQVKTCFVTSRQVADKISQELGINCFWIPEGINITDYHFGNKLEERTIDVYELGRQHSHYHIHMMEMIKKRQIKSYIGNTYTSNGKLKSLAFPTADDLIQNLPKIKIVICFPQTDTHPQRAGKVETLTQRYWEAMLSRCLIVGRAPQELIDFIGYNPVIQVDWNNPEKQMNEILSNIQLYQDLVDKNYKTAQIQASWDNRIKQIIQILSHLN